VMIPDDDLTVEAYLLEAFSELKKEEARLREMEEKLAIDHQSVNLEEYARLQSHFLSRDGYNVEYQLANVFTRFGFTEEELQRKLPTFSGGQKTKIAFARLLLSKPDLLLLDEPTNHLDLSTIDWLEDYLRDYPSALVIVSHDRYFIDSIANVTYELVLGSIKRFGGNYSYFLAAKKLALEQEALLYKNQQEEIARLELLIEKFRYKKSKAAFAQSKIKYLERMDKVELTKTATKNFKADFNSKLKGGKTVCVLSDYAVGYQQPLATLNLEILSGARIGVVGPNGCGKSTLLKTIAGKLEQLQGECHLGHQISIGYFDQELDVLDADNNVVEELWESYPLLTNTEVRTVLGRFLFSGDEVFKTISVLSGGEKVRLAFAKLMLNRDNFLLLDEPTNHLDIPAKEALEEALTAYNGTLLFVSHDRYFISRLASSLLIYEEGDFHYYPLNYQEYTERNKKPKTSKAANKTEEKKVEDNNPGKTLAKLEKQITKTETDLEKLEALLNDEEYYEDFLKHQQLTEEIEALQDKLAGFLEKWESLQ